MYLRHKQQTHKTCSSQNKHKITNFWFSRLFTTFTGKWCELTQLFLQARMRAHRAWCGRRGTCQSCQLKLSRKDAKRRHEMSNVRHVSLHIFRSSVVEKIPLMLLRWMWFVLLVEKTGLAQCSHHWYSFPTSYHTKTKEIADSITLLRPADRQSSCTWERSIIQHT